MMDAFMGGQNPDLRGGASAPTDPEEAKLDQMIRKEMKREVLLKLREGNAVLERRVSVPLPSPSSGLHVSPPLHPMESSVSPPTTMPLEATPHSLELPPVAVGPLVPSSPVARASNDSDGLETGAKRTRATCDTSDEDVGVKKKSATLETGDRKENVENEYKYNAYEKLKPTRVRNKKSDKFVLPDGTREGLVFVLGEIKAAFARARARGDNDTIWKRLSSKWKFRNGHYGTINYLRDHDKEFNTGEWYRDRIASIQNGQNHLVKLIAELQHNDRIDDSVDEKFYWEWWSK